MSLPIPKYKENARRDAVTEFRGLNRTDMGGEGGGIATFSDMQNGSTDAYPFACSRAARALKTLESTACALKGGEVLARVEPPYLYYGDEQYDLSLSAGDKQIVMMGTDLLIFPDGMYFDTVSKEYGSVDTGTTGADREFILGYSRIVTFAFEGGKTTIPCKIQVGNVVLKSLELSDFAGKKILKIRKLYNELPNEVKASISIGNDNYRPYAILGGKLYYMYSAKSESSPYTTWTDVEWRELPLAYAEVEADLEDIGFSDETASNLWCGGTAIRTEETKNEKGTTVLRFEGHSLFACAEIVNYHVSIEGSERDTFAVKKIFGSKIVQKTLPALDHVVVHENRLFGCRYGEQIDGEKHANRLYASKLGDYKVWEEFRGISTDPWYGYVGEEGPFTGACLSPEGRPMFFKEDYAYILYGDYPPYSYSKIDIRGVAEGAAKSLCYVDGALYWKSRHDIMRYTGASLSPISLPLGDISSVSRALAGAWKSKYYISMNGLLYVYDTVRGTWVVEDAVDAVDFAEVRGEFYMLCTGGRLYTVDTKAEEAIPWSLTSAHIGYNMPNRKYISQLRIRIELAEGATLDKVEISLDGGDFFEASAKVQFEDGAGRRTGTVLIPLRPRRCETFRYRLCGVGAYKLTGVTKRIEEGGR